MLNRKISDEEIKQMISKSKERFSKIGISVQSPSHRDLLSSFINKCDRYTEGTACTTSDLETDKVECWTPKKNATNFVACSIAKIDNILTKEIGGAPKKWISPLFTKEVIELTN